MAKNKSLTKRELQVMEQVKEMLTNKEIANILCVSKHTIKAHVTNAIYKLNAKNRYHAVIIAAKMGLITL